MSDPLVRRSSTQTIVVPPKLRIPLAWPLTLVAAATIVALAAQVAAPVPFSPVPFTLQGLAVLLVGGLFGSAIGAGALFLYLVAGAFGAPVFSPLGPAGLARLFGPTGGYLLAFPVAAAVVGWIAERRHFVRCLVGCLAGMVVIYLGGWAQLAIITGNAGRAATLGIVPFLLQDSLKVVLAAVILWRAHHALRLRS
jgi:biotin transport system substrate-specific component